MKDPAMTDDPNADLVEMLCAAEPSLDAEWFEGSVKEQHPITLWPNGLQRLLAWANARRDAAVERKNESFQKRVDDWIQYCFGPKIGADRTERNHRFLEEALETVQSGGCTASEAHQLVDYVYGRPIGEMDQEVGGVMVTLAALCNAHGVDLDAAAERELARVWVKSEKIRAKQAAKPKHSPLPERVTQDPRDAEIARLRSALEAAQTHIADLRERDYDSFTVEGDPDTMSDDEATIVQEHDDVLSIIAAALSGTEARNA